MNSLLEEMGAFYGKPLYEARVCVPLPSCILLGLGVQRESAFPAVREAVPVFDAASWRGFSGRKVMDGCDRSEHRSAG